MFNKLFKKNKPLIGMIHLLALPGYEEHPGMKVVTNKALTDLQTLQKAGYDGVLVENDNDQPHQIGVSDSISEAFTKVMQEIISKSKIPVGMEIIYDMTKTVEIANSLKASFVRLDVFVDDMQTHWGTISAEAERIVFLNNKFLGHRVALFVDVHVKHANLVNPRSLQKSLAETVSYSPDAVIVSGSWTGKPPTIKNCLEMKKGARGIPILIGSGLNLYNINSLLNFTDGGIVGTSIKTGDHVDFIKAKKLVRIKEKFSKIGSTNSN